MSHDICEKVIWQIIEKYLKLENLETDWSRWKDCSMLWIFVLWWRMQIYAKYLNSKSLQLIKRLIRNQLAKSANDDVNDETRACFECNEDINVDVYFSSFLNFVPKWQMWLLWNDTINDRNDLFVDVNAAHCCSWHDRNDCKSKKKNREKAKKYENERRNLVGDIEHFV